MVSFGPNIVQAEFFLPDRPFAGLHLGRKIVIRFFDSRRVVTRLMTQLVLLERTHMKQIGRISRSKGSARFFFESQEKRVFRAFSAMQECVLERVITEMRKCRVVNGEVALERHPNIFTPASFEELPVLFEATSSARSVCVFLFEPDDLCFSAQTPVQYPIQQ